MKGRRRKPLAPPSEAAKRIALGLRTHVLGELIRFCPGEPIDVLLSGGVDSTSLLVAAVELGRDVRAVSFALAGSTSSDLEQAERTARHFGVPFERVDVPRDARALLPFATALVAHHGVRLKTGVECGVPVFYALERRGARPTVGGSCADGLFVLSKKGMIALGKGADVQALRTTYFERADPAQVNTLRRAASVPVLFPYAEPRLVELFEGASWRDTNRPRQKEPIRLAFSAMDALNLGIHSNLHEGGSGIKEVFAELGPLLGLRSSSVVAINELVRRAAMAEIVVCDEPERAALEVARLRAVERWCYALRSDQITDEHLGRRFVVLGDSARKALTVDGRRCSFGVVE